MMFRWNIQLFSQSSLKGSQSGKCGDIGSPAFFHDPYDSLKMVIGESKTGEIIEKI